MLSDREREELDEIRNRLATDDPEFVELFGPGSRRLGVLDPSRREAAATVLLVVTLLLSLLMIVVHAPGPALLFTGLACWEICLRARHPIGGRCRDA